MRSIGLSAVVSFFMVIGVLCCCYNSHAATTLLLRCDNFIATLRQHGCCATATWLSQSENNGKRVKKLQKVDLFFRVIKYYVRVIVLCEELLYPLLLLGHELRLSIMIAIVHTCSAEVFPHQ